MRWKPTLTLVASVTALLNAGYLPLLGPAPLRFRQDVPGPAYVLPPLKMQDEPPADSSPAPAADTSSAASDTEPPADTSPASVDSNTTTNGTGSTNAPAAVQPTVSGTEEAPAVAPQVLLQFFRPNPSNGVSVVAPINFSPPVTQPRSSSATYQSR